MSSRSNRSGHRGRARHGHTHAHAQVHVEAAATQQAEQQLLAAALNPAPRHTYSSDDEDDEDFAEFKRQAAQLAGQAKPQPILPEGLEFSKFSAAVQQLQEHGISKEAATDALLTSAEQHWRDFDTWLLQAQVFLALRQETELEAEKMRQAMEASIQERDQRQQMEQQARPELTNLSGERLRKRFAGSAVLEQLHGLLPSAVLFCDKQPVFGLIKCPLVALLRLEERCCKWWPGQGTIQYFSTFADRCIRELSAKMQSNSRRTTLSAEVASAALQQQQSSQDQADDVQQQHTAASPASRVAVQDQHQQTMLPAKELHQQQHMLLHNDADSTSIRRQSDARAKSEPVLYAASLKSHKQDDRANSVSSASAATAPAAAAAAAVAGDTDRRHSKRKRQLPERYRSASPPVPAATRPRSRKTPSPDLADVDCCCQAKSNEAQSAAAAAASHGAKPTKPVGTGLIPLQQHLSLNQQVAADYVANGSSCDAAGNGQMAAGLPPAAAGAGPSANEAAGDGQPGAQAALQLQLKQLSQGVSSGRSLGLGYEVVVVQRLSQLLQCECETLQEMVYSFPSAAGSVPAIFKGDEGATADSDADGSDVELVDELPVPAAASAAAPLMGAINGEAGTSATAIEAAVASPGNSLDHSPAPQFQQQHEMYFQMGCCERSPSVEIVSD